MIKLKRGDYVNDLTKRQFDIIIKIEGHELVFPFSKVSNRLFYDGVDLLYLTDIRMSEGLNQLTYKEFKQRAINTFKS